MAIWEVAFDQTIQGSARPVVNVFHVISDEVTTPAALATFVSNTWVGNVAPYQADDVRYERCRLRQLDGFAYHELALGTPGGATSDALPPNVALLLKKVAENLPRRRYGRMFIAGMPESEISNGGQWTSGVMTGWTERMANVLGQLDLGGAPMVQVLGEFQGQAGNTLSTRLVTSLTPVLRAASQKRRLRK